MTANLTQSIWRAEQVRQYEIPAAAKIGTDSFQLMRQAGEAVAQLTTTQLKLSPEYIPDIVVFVGTGNNGGDGYIAAASLHQSGLNVTLVELMPEIPRQGDAQTAKTLWESQSAPHQTITLDNLILNENSCVIDALLGTGITREVSGKYAECISLINQTNNHSVIAVDIPSGIHANTGVPQGEAIVADHTITFVATKPGLVTGIGKSHCGELHFDSLGILAQFAELASPIAQHLYHKHPYLHLPKRPAHAHKGMFGHILIIGGNKGMSGAIRLSAEAALRTGAGLVSVLTHSSHQHTVAAHMPEIMVHGIDETCDPTVLTAPLHNASHIVIGPGLGKTQWAKQLLHSVITHQSTHRIPTVFDADALNLLAELTHESTTAVSFDPNCVFTPHPAEAARLLHSTTKHIEADRYDAVKQIAQRYNVTALLKGAGTLICSPVIDKTFVNTTGNPGMATAGMGDVLSGIVAALLAQQLPSINAACYGAWLHGAAGDKAAEQGARGLIASDLFPHLRQLIG